MTVVRGVTLVAAPGLLLPAAPASLARRTASFTRARALGVPLPRAAGVKRERRDSDVGAQHTAARGEMNPVPSSRPRWGRILLPVLFCLASVTEGRGQPARTQG